MSKIEVEVKALMTEDQAMAIQRRLINADYKASREEQLNHYYHKPRSLTNLPGITALYLPAEMRQYLEGYEYSLRTRYILDLSSENAPFHKTLLVVKLGGVNDGVRREFEIPFKWSIYLLDYRLGNAGYTIESMWSRDRITLTHPYDSITYCLDKNAGYGWVAEFEKMVDTEDQVEQAEQDILASMDELGLTPLSHNKLARMYEHYVLHWPDYYNTGETFDTEAFN